MFFILTKAVVLTKMLFLHSIPLPRLFTLAGSEQTRLGVINSEFSHVRFSSNRPLNVTPTCLQVFWRTQGCQPSRRVVSCHTALLPTPFEQNISLPRRVASCLVYVCIFWCINLVFDFSRYSDFLSCIPCKVA